MGQKSKKTGRIDELLRSSGIVAGGFLGSDKRSVEDIIRTDIELLKKAGYTATQLARRMRQLTDLAWPRMGNPVTVEGKIVVSSEDYKGPIICPWGDGGCLVKRITTAKRLEVGKAVAWTDLNIHLIESHGFFEGRGATFRIEPDEIAAVVF